MPKMCLYRIQEAPYLAVSNVRKAKLSSCLVEDTHGQIKKVRPLYVGPFDGEKLFKFGALVSNYFTNTADLQTVKTKSCEIFNLDPMLV